MKTFSLEKVCMRSDSILAEYITEPNAAYETCYKDVWDWAWPCEQEDGYWVPTLHFCESGQPVGGQQHIRARPEGLVMITPLSSAQEVVEMMQMHPDSKIFFNHVESLKYKVSYNKMNLITALDTLNALTAKDAANIKRAYRAKVLVNHPNKPTGSSQAFMKDQAALEWLRTHSLSDPSLPQQLDRVRENKKKSLEKEKTRKRPYSQKNSQNNSRKRQKHYNTNSVNWFAKHSALHLIRIYVTELLLSQGPSGLWDRLMGIYPRPTIDEKTAIVVNHASLPFKNTLLFHDKERHGQPTVSAGFSLDKITWNGQPVWNWGAYGQQYWLDKLKNMKLGYQTEVL